MTATTATNEDNTFMTLEIVVFKLGEFSGGLQSSPVAAELTPHRSSPICADARAGDKTNAKLASRLVEINIFFIICIMLSLKY
jgi:hypothetical protein